MSISSRSAASQRWEIRSAFDSFDDVFPSWNRIAAQTPLSSFVDSSWFLSSREAFPDDLHNVNVHLLRHFDAVLAAVPLRRSLSPIPTLSSVSNDHFPCWAFPFDFNHPKVAQDLLQHALLSADCLSLGSLHFDSPLCRNLISAANKLHLHSNVTPDNEDSFIRLLPWSEMQKSMAHKLKADRNRTRRLEELGHLNFETIQGGPLLDKRLSECFHLETLGWKGNCGRPILADPQTLRFYTALAHRASNQGSLRLFCLSLDQRIIAFQFCLQSSSRIDALKISFDPEFARFSPGDMLLLRALEQASTQKLAPGYHFGRPSSWKLRWATGSNPLCRIRIYSNSLRASLAYHLGPNLKSTLQNHPRLLQTLKGLRSAVHPT